MHFTRRLALSSALVGVVALALPWKYEDYLKATGQTTVIEYWGVDSPRAMLLAGLLAIGGLVSGMGERDEPLSRKIGVGLLVSSSCALGLSLLFLMLFLFDATWWAGFGLYFQTIGPSLGLWAGIVTLRRGPDAQEDGSLPTSS